LKKDSFRGDQSRFFSLLATPKTPKKMEKFYSALAFVGKILEVGLIYAWIVYALVMYFVPYLIFYCLIKETRYRPEGREAFLSVVIITVALVILQGFTLYGVGVHKIFNDEYGLRIEIILFAIPFILNIFFTCRALGIKRIFSKGKHYLVQEGGNPEFFNQELEK
jgi:hypothetical protein